MQYQREAKPVFVEEAAPVTVYLDWQQEQHRLQTHHVRRQHPDYTLTVIEEAPPATIYLDWQQLQPVPRFNRRLQNLPVAQPFSVGEFDVSWQMETNLLQRVHRTNHENLLTPVVIADEGGVGWLCAPVVQRQPVLRIQPLSHWFPFETPAAAEETGPDEPFTATKRRAIWRGVSSRTSDFTGRRGNAWTGQDEGR